ncbi:MAG: PHP domain-containing protein [Flavobacteriaceae bacterium]|nr:PHP domain-containing protein [Flavobacteriaceae bacterium]
MNSYRINFHTHTFKSFDGYNSYKSIYKFSKKVGLDYIAITDHDTIEGALGFKKWIDKNEVQDLKVIIGEEITCTEGIHIIGLFLKNHIPSDTVENVVNAILNQDALVYFPHPTRKDGILSLKSPNKVIDKGHFYEVFNAKVNDAFNISAQESFLNYNHLIPLAGSDAHYNSDLLKCYCEIELMPGQPLKEGLLNHAITINVFGKKKTTSGNQYFSSYYKYKEKLNLPKFIREIAKVVFPLYKNFKERSRSYNLEHIFSNAH